MFYQSSDWILIELGYNSLNQPDFVYCTHIKNEICSTTRDYTNQRKNMTMISFRNMVVASIEQADVVIAVCFLVCFS